MNTLFAHCKFVIFFGFALNDLFYSLSRLELPVSTAFQSAGSQITYCNLELLKLQKAWGWIKS